jgi:hypothetical protein
MTKMQKIDYCQQCKHFWPSTCFCGELQKVVNGDSIHPDCPLEDAPLPKGCCHVPHGSKHCPICGKDFMTPQGMGLHFKRMHGDVADLNFL